MKGRTKKSDSNESSTPSALFIPLKRRYFEEFERGEKHFEYRTYGPRWNEKTCAIGRRVTLSLGYGKQRRLTGEVTSFSTCATPSQIPGWADCFGDSHFTAAVIGIRVDPSTSMSEQKSHESPPGGRCLATYRQECAMRWSGDALRNARCNWARFQERHANIVALLEPYLKDSGCRDIAGNYHNPDHTLTGWLWKCSEAKENWWIWDFCDHYQKCHLRRGLIIYCKMVIAEIKAAQDPAPGHPELPLSQSSCLAR